MNEKAYKTPVLWSSCCFGGWISHEVYFHSKGRPVSCCLNELSVLLAFLRQLFTDQSGNGTKKKILSHGIHWGKFSLDPHKEDPNHRCLILAQLTRIPSNEKMLHCFLFPYLNFIFACSSVFRDPKVTRVFQVSQVLQVYEGKRGRG